MNHHNHHPYPSPPSQSTTTVGGGCGNCGTQIRIFLHNVRLRGIQRKLCTSCVLRLHPSSFCPLCFTFYDSNPPHPSKRLSCAKCASLAHSHCITSSSLSQQPFLCPSCSDPTSSFTFFKNPTSKNKNDVSSETDNVHVIDSKSAAVLLCAAKIAAASMGKAVLVARIEAEKKAKDAALAKKRAREALEHVGVLISKSNNNVNNNKDRNFDGSVQLSGSGNASSFNVNKKQQSVSMSPNELVNNVNVKTDNG